MSEVTSRDLILGQIKLLLDERQGLDADIMELEMDCSHLSRSTLEMWDIINAPSSVHYLHPKHKKPKTSHMASTAAPTKKTETSTIVQKEQEGGIGSQKSNNVLDVDTAPDVDTTPESNKAEGNETHEGDKIPEEEDTALAPEEQHKKTEIENVNGVTIAEPDEELNKAVGETRGDDTTPDSNKSEGLANCTSTVLVDKQNQKTDIENEPEVTIAEPREGSDKAMDPLDEIKCSVCYNGDNEENNLIVICENTECNTAVHQACYGGLKVIPEGPWYCRPCAEKVRMEERICVLCPVKGGALKPVQQDGSERAAGKKQEWAHIMCCMWGEGTYFVNADKMEPIAGVKKVLKAKHTVPCFICKGNTGAILSCSSNCGKRFHPTCGVENNCTLNLRLGSNGKLEWNVACDVHSPKGKMNSKTIYTPTGSGVGSSSSSNIM